MVVGLAVMSVAVAEATAASRMLTHGTTVLCVRQAGTVVMASDGQVTLGQQILKSNARKVRRLGKEDQVLAGFAGGTADALTLFELFDANLEQHQGNLRRAAVELAKSWRTERRLRRLEALLCVADLELTLTLSGNGDVLEPEHNVIGIGSGGGYAMAAARALLRHSSLSARDIAASAMDCAAELCIYTNNNLVLEELPGPSVGKGS